MGMTIDKAQSNLRNIQRYYIKADNETIDFAIDILRKYQKLEQEPILDKIRAEILEISSYEGFELGGVKDGYRIAMVNVLDIIDKYRTVREEEHADSN